MFEEEKHKNIRRHVAFLGLKVSPKTQYARQSKTLIPLKKPDLLAFQLPLLRPHHQHQTQTNADTPTQDATPNRQGRWTSCPAILLPLVNRDPWVSRPFRH